MRQNQVQMINNSGVMERKQTEIEVDEMTL